MNSLFEDDIRLDGVVRTIVSEKSFGCIYSVSKDLAVGTAPDQVIRVRVPASATLYQPRPGEPWTFTGCWRSTPWGLQLDVRSAQRRQPTGKLIEAYLSSCVPGIGPERAKRLWDRWGGQLPDVLCDPSRVAEVADVLAPDRPIAGPALAAACHVAWTATAASGKAVAWLNAHGIDDLRTTRTILSILGEDVVPSMSENPYLLVPLLPWSKVDSLGLQILKDSAGSNARRDPRRLVGAVDETVKRAIADGHTAISAPALRQSLASILRTDATSPLITEAVSLARDAGAILETEHCWRAPGCASMEDDLVDRLRGMIDGDHPSDVSIPDGDVLRSTLSAFRIGGHQMHREQQDAVESLLTRRVGVLQGGAGVGKTTTLQALCTLWERYGGVVLGCTVSGKAALRLSQSTGGLAMTLARLLGQIQQRETLERQLLDEADEEKRRKIVKRLAELAAFSSKTLVVIDEASMLDLPTAYDLVRRLPSGARLVLVGDEAQLPPVGFGLVYHRLVQDERVTVRLNKVHRQSSESGIPRVAAIIREGAMPTLPAYQGAFDGVSFLHASMDALPGAVIEIHQTLSAASREPLICTATRAGVAGMRQLNERLQRKYAESSEGGSIKGHGRNWFCIHDPVVWLRNDYSLGLFNGLLGKIIWIDSEAGQISVHFDGYASETVLSREQLIDLDLAYAITCHRAQGSQAPSVIVPIYESRMVDPSWLYTAVTRAQQQVVLVGDEQFLRAALGRPWSARRRCVGLSWP